MARQHQQGRCWLLVLQEQGAVQQAGAPDEWLHLDLNTPGTRPTAANAGHACAPSARFSNRYADMGGKNVPICVSSEEEEEGEEGGAVADAHAAHAAQQGAEA